MAVDLPESPVLLPVTGVRLATVYAGIRKAARADLMLMEIAAGAASAAVFTRNKSCAAPVIIARRHLAQTSPRYCLVNAGNANAGTGARGEADALAACAALAQLAECAPQAVLPFSTGVIGEPLPVDKLIGALPAAYATLSAEAWLEAARAIMTTDTVPKGISRRITIDGAEVTITGIVKGAGMIRPDMATMLAFIATDARVVPAVLQDCLAGAVDRSFHRITIDGDTSTNDACLLVATGASGMPSIESAESPQARRFAEALTEVCVALAQAVVRDGEGATRFITIEVSGGSSVSECLAVAFTVAHSPLVKTAAYACDPNWGRILAAVGRAPADIDMARVDVYLGDRRIVHRGARSAEYREDLARQIMQRSEYTLRVDLGRGTARAEVWTCDLSPEYVRINADYRT
jgi:glutamate N-acetyltransferase/amino-acid N-acetyltransferase